MQLFRTELYRALRGPWFLGSLLALTALSVAGAIGEIGLYVGNWDWIIEKFANESYYYHTIYSCFNMWLPLRGGASDASSLFFTLLPLLALMGYAWSLAADVRSGYIAQLTTRAPRTRLFMARCGATFMSAGLLAVVPLIINFLVLICFLPAYTPSVVDRMYIALAPSDAFSSLFFTAPLLYIVLKCALNFVLCGLWATMVLGFSTLTSNRVALICAPYIILLLIKHLGENLYVMMRLKGYSHFGMSITLFDQLKSGGDSFFCYWWATLTCALLMLALSLIVPYLRRRADIL